MSRTPAPPASTRPPARPPRNAERLLVAVLPEGMVGNTILGDLRQEFDERAARHGRLRLWLGYWIQALEIAARYEWRAFRYSRPDYRPLATTRSSDKSGQPAEEIMSTFISDLRYGARLLVKSPVLSVVSIATIALGIGLTTHTFSLVYGSVLRGLPVRDADRLINIEQSIPERGITETSPSYHDFLDYGAQQSSFEYLAIAYENNGNLASDGQPPERYQLGVVSANALDQLGVPPVIGRTFAEGEDRPGADLNVVLGYDLWRNRFEADETVLGRIVRINGDAAEVIGVMPPKFAFPFSAEMWVTHRLDADAYERARSPGVDIFAHLREGVSIDAARAEFEAIDTEIRGRHPEVHAGRQALIRPFADGYMPPEITAVLMLMLGAVFGVLLIACANVANLLLARATVRGKEVAVRTALGASRGRVIRQLMAESLLLAVVGGAIGLGVAKVALDGFNSWIADIQKPFWIDARMDVPTLLFTFTIVLVTAVVAGIVPALRASGTGVHAILQDQTRGASSLRMGRFSSLLVVGEIAVSCALLVMAGLLVKSIVNVNTVNLGFRSEGIYTGRVGLYENDYPDRAEREQFFADLIARLREEPGVRSAALATSLPGAQSDRWSFAIEGAAYDNDADYPVTNGAAVGTDFFSTYDVPVLQGRAFVPGETGAEAESAVIVNESFVRSFFGERPPLGQRLRIGRGESTNPWMRIVGVVPDLHVTGGVGGIGSDRIRPEHIYVSQGTFDFRFWHAVVRADAPAEEILPRMRGVVAEMDPDLPMFELMPMQQALEQYTWAFTVFGALFSSLGGSALFLAAVGLYGVMAFSVSNRSQELGIRMALGASAKSILRLVLRKGVGQLGVGLVLGLTMGAALARPMTAVTYGVSWSDPSVYAAILLTLLATGLIATLVPARRATRLDPNEALRSD